MAADDQTKNGPNSQGEPAKPPVVPSTAERLTDWEKRSKETGSITPELLAEFKSLMGELSKDFQENNKTFLKERELLIKARDNHQQEFQEKVTVLNAEVAAFAEQFEVNGEVQTEAVNKYVEDLYAKLEKNEEKWISKDDALKNQLTALNEKIKNSENEEELISLREEQVALDEKRQALAIEEQTLQQERAKLTGIVGEDGKVSADKNEQAESLIKEIVKDKNDQVKQEITSLEKSVQKFSEAIVVMDLHQANAEGLPDFIKHMTSKIESGEKTQISDFLLEMNYLSDINKYFKLNQQYAEESQNSRKTEVKTIRDLLGNLPQEISKKMQDVKSWGTKMFGSEFMTVLTKGLSVGKGIMSFGLNFGTHMNALKEKFSMVGDIARGFKEGGIKGLLGSTKNSLKETFKPAESILKSSEAYQARMANSSELSESAITALADEGVNKKQSIAVHDWHTENLLKNNFKEKARLNLSSQRDAKGKWGWLRRHFTNTAEHQEGMLKQSKLANFLSKLNAGSLMKMLTGGGIFRTLIGFLTSFLGPLLGGKLFGGITDLLGIGGKGGRLGKLMGGIGKLVGKIPGGKFLTGLFKGGGAVGGLAKAGSGILGGIAKAGGGLLKAAGPLAAVASIGMGAVNAYKTFQDPNATAADKGKAVGGVAGGAVGAALGSFLGPIGTMAGAWLGEKVGGFVGEKIGPAVGAAWDGIKEMGSKIKDVGGKMWDGVTGFFGNAKDVVSEKLSGAWDGIKSVGSGIWGGIKGFFSGDDEKKEGEESSTSAWDVIKAMNPIANVASGIWGGIKGFFSGDDEKKENEESSTGAWDVIKAMNPIANVASGIWGGITSLFGDKKEEIEGAEKTSGLWDTIKTANPVLNVASKIGSSVGGFFSSLFGSGEEEMKEVVTGADETQTVLSTTLAVTDEIAKVTALATSTLEAINIPEGERLGDKFDALNGQQERSIGVLETGFNSLVEAFRSMSINVNQNTNEKVTIPSDIDSLGILMTNRVWGT